MRNNTTLISTQANQDKFATGKHLTPVNMVIQVTQENVQHSVIIKIGWNKDIGISEVGRMTQIRFLKDMPCVDSK